jgi:hypothetical protein
MISIFIISLHTACCDRSSGFDADATHLVSVVFHYAIGEIQLLVNTVFIIDVLFPRGSCAQNR